MVIINIICFLLLLLLIFYLTHNALYMTTLARKVMFALILGVIFGGILNISIGVNSESLVESIKWFDLIGKGYISLLQMVVMPLVLVSILSSVAKLSAASQLGRIATVSITILLVTTAIAALVGILVANLFSLTAEGLIHGQAEANRLSSIETNQALTLSKNHVTDLLLALLPNKPFADLTWNRPTSIIAVVIFATFLGLSILHAQKDDAIRGKALVSAVESLQLLVTKLVYIIMQLTPYGVFALMTKVCASSNAADVLRLGMFVIASYTAIAIMFAIHAILIAASGMNPIGYYKKVLPVLAFAFTSRSSAATIPLNIETQKKNLRVPDAIAGFCASFGATIGQNGCAGLYPAMLAVMVAPTMNIDPLSIEFILPLIGISTISSAGIAGVGGGATFAALIVLPAMGLPIEIVALLISVEPLIDMGRTALNVNDAIVTGVLTSKILT